MNQRTKSIIVRAVSEVAINLLEYLLLIEWCISIGMCGAPQRLSEINVRQRRGRSIGRRNWKTRAAAPAISTPLELPPNNLRVLLLCV